MNLTFNTTLINTCNKYVYQVDSNPEDYLHFNADIAYADTTTDKDHAPFYFHNETFGDMAVICLLPFTKNNNFSKSASQNVYLQKCEITSELQQKPVDDIEKQKIVQKNQKKLHEHQNIVQSCIFLYRCFYCEECFEGNDGNECNIKRIEHMDIEHRGKPHYPTPEDFENRMERQGSLQYKWNLKKF